MNTSTTSRRAALWRLARTRGRDDALGDRAIAPWSRVGPGPRRTGFGPLGHTGNSSPSHPHRITPIRPPELIREYWSAAVHRHDNAATPIRSWIAAQLSYRMARRAYRYGYREGIRLGAGVAPTTPSLPVAFLPQPHNLTRPQSPAPSATGSAPASSATGSAPVMDGSGRPLTQAAGHPT